MLTSEGFKLPEDDPAILALVADIKNFSGKLAPKGDVRTQLFELGVPADTFAIIDDPLLDYLRSAQISIASLSHEIRQTVAINSLIGSSHEIIVIKKNIDDLYFPRVMQISVFFNQKAVACVTDFVKDANGRLINVLESSPARFGIDFGKFEKDLKAEADHAMQLAKNGGAPFDKDAFATDFVIGYLRDTGIGAAFNALNGTVNESVTICGNILKAFVPLVEKAAGVNAERRIT